MVVAAAVLFVACGEDDEQLTVRAVGPTPDETPMMGDDENQRLSDEDDAPPPDSGHRPPAYDEPEATVVRDLGEFVRKYGYPRGTDFATLRIPVLNVEARVGAWHVGRGEQMPEPHGPADIAWYDLSDFPGMGGRPGEGANAIFGGHVDLDLPIPYAGVRYRGPAVFAQLGRLSSGDIVEIDYEGETLCYRVVWRRSLSAEPGATDWGEVWRGTPGVDEVTLYTCGGDFDPQTREYRDRVVVRVERI